MLGAAVLWLAAPALAQRRAREAEVKAAYVYKFLAYAEWPASALPAERAPWVVGVAGSDELADTLVTITASRREAQRPIEIRRVAEGDPVEGLHALFMARGQPVARWVARLQGRPVLTISDDPRGLEAGSMLNLVPGDGRIRFEASLAAMQSSGVKLSARALAVADRVVGP